MDDHDWDQWYEDAYWVTGADRDDDDCDDDEYSSSDRMSCGGCLLYSLIGLGTGLLIVFFFGLP